MGKGTDREKQATAREPERTSERVPQEVLELDYLYDALAHPRRRYLCYTLLEDAEWSLSDLATKVAAWEADVPEGEVTDTRRERVYVSLYHAQIPRLVDEGVVTFDETRETITAGENATSVLAALRAVGEMLDDGQEEHARGKMHDKER